MRSLISIFIAMFILLTLFAQTNALCNNPCLMCSVNSTTYCTTCVSSYTLAPNGICVLMSCQVPYCSICQINNAAVCLACLPSFVLLNVSACTCQTGFTPIPYGSPSAVCTCNSTACMSCPIGGCLTCSSASTCSSCTGGTVSTLSLGCITCGVTNCQTCLVNKFCLNCAGSNSVSIDGYCTICPVNCIVCASNSSSCIQCAVGYSLTKTGLTYDCSTLCSVPFCVQCSSNNVCQYCAYGYTVFINTVVCATYSLAPYVPFPCVQSSYNYPRSVCLLCNMQYFSQTQAYSCANCPIANCQQCYFNTNSTQCNYCITGFALDANYNCVLINALNCSITTNDLTQCITCKNYFTSINGICFPCTVQACISCNPNNTGLCTACQAGTYLSGVVCLPCQPYCITCTNSSSCLTLSNNAIIINSQYYYAICAFSCLTCSPQNPAACSKCRAGFYFTSSLSGGICLPCDPSSGCYNCSNSNPSQCISCLNNGILIQQSNGNTVCQYCTSPCASCNQTSQTSCLSCVFGYYLVGTQCLPNTCSPNCAYCASNSSCLICMSGYFPNAANGTCLPGLQGCIKVAPQAPFICLGCAPGNGLNVYTSTCFQCPPNCISCASPSLCLSCQAGYNLTSGAQIQCVQLCNVPCATCQNSNPSFCLSCLAGYTYNSNGTCTPTANCLSCIVCPFGYSFSTTQTCVACGSSCATCNGQSPQTCTSCYPGQWLNSNSVCVSCSANCAFCTNLNTCNLCQIGYYLTGWSISTSIVSGVNSCLPCQFPCLTCLYVSSVCMTCINGYTLLGNQCVNNYNYQLNIVFNSSVSSFNQNYGNIVQSLLNTINTQSQSNFFVTTYYPSSSAILYSVWLSSQCVNQASSCTNTQINNINQLLSTSNIGGLPIVTSTMTPSNGSTTQNCQSPCVTCTTIGGKVCTSCIVGYTLVNSNCVPDTCPIPYCQICGAGGVCMQCQPTFYLSQNQCVCATGFAPSTVSSSNAFCMCASGVNATSSNSSCRNCQVNNCQTCSTSGGCGACFSGYTLVSGGSACVTCPLTCLGCLAQNVCSNCTAGYSLSLTSTCVLCSNVTAGCLICSSDNVCASCITGYTASSSSGNLTCIQCFIENCMSCNSSNTCTQCNNGYVINNNNTCISNAIIQLNCLPPCLNCAYNGQCAQCITYLYSSIPNTNNTCFICNVSNCIVCSSSNPSSCTQCAQNYVQVEGRLGFVCQLSSYYGCSNISTTNSSCIACMPYFTLMSDGTCAPCMTYMQGCSQCYYNNPSYCIACQSSLQTANGHCQPCDPFCLTCNPFCVYNPQRIIVGGRSYISPCFPPCIQCFGDNPYVCNLCSNGFVLINSICVSCNGCKQCLSSNVSQCLSCYNFQLLTSNLTCIPCSSPCLSCNGTPSTCTSCLSSYQLVNNTCVNYTQNSTNFCASWGPNGCSICYSGYLLANTNLNCIYSWNCTGPYTCIPGMNGCLASVPGNPYICQACDYGMVLNISNGVCLQCPLNCQSCYLDSVCTSCYQGYYLTGSFGNITCAPNCLFPCSTCDFSDPSICTTCLAGYVASPFAATLCQPLNVLLPNNSVCPSGYGLSTNNTCALCANSSNCKACAKLLPAQCISCFVGYYLSTLSTCIQCPNGCSNCTSSTTCTQCSPGYYNTQYYQSTLEIPSCAACGPTCATCRTGPNQCITCNPGYLLVGTQCMASFIYYFGMNLNTNYNNFLQNYIPFLNQIQSYIENGVTPTNPRLISLQRFNSTGSSVIVQGILSSGCLQGTGCANAENLRLQNFFSSQTVASMSFGQFILQQTGSAPFTNTNSTQNQTNPVFNCSIPCTVCNYTTGTCTSCPLAYQLINGICLLNNCTIFYCAVCASNNSAQCLQCNPTFLLNSGVCICQAGWAPSPAGDSNATCVCSGGNCTTCKIQNCLICNQTNFCISCIAPYQVNSQGNCVSCNIDFCLNCASPNYCSACATGYSASVNGNQCIICMASNCLYCSTQTSCGVCQPGYVFDNQNVACVTCNIPNCLSCQGNNVCYTCAPSYVLTSNFTCVFSTCQYPCASCLVNGSCLTCFNPPFQMSPNNGQCYSCNVANCAFCDFDSQVCTVCQNGFVLSGNNTQCASSCPIAGCLACSSNSQCISCSLTFTLNQGSCIACASGCATCLSANTSNCNSCSTGFYPSKDGTSCLICPSFCGACTSASSCSQPQQSYGQTLVQINGSVYLASCDQGCSQCSSVNPTICLSCLNGYYLNQNICLPCTPASNCQTCSVSNPQICLSCFPNTYLSSSNGINICSSCVSPCVTCQQNQLSSCLSCPLGYLLQNNTCLSDQCPLFCLTCSSQQNCIQCALGYASINGICLPCIAGCSVCSVSSPGICLSCSVGTYLNTATQQCVGCSLGCQACLQSGCTTCYSGYYLTSNLTCAVNCIYPCATCSANNPSNCLSCQVGYIYNPSSIQNCQPDLSCSSTFSCITCPLGYTLTSSLQCQQCSSSCARCLDGFSQICTSCASNQYLNGSVCISCPSNCASCLSVSVCLQCANGYTSINLASTSSPAYCVACESPCQTCVNSPQNCLTCISTYTLQNAKCLSNFNYGFSVLLDVTSSQFYQNYQGFISNLSSNVQGNAGYVNIQSISSGSTNVTGIISTLASPQTQASNNYYNNLLNSLTTNNNFAGMKVLSSQVNANGGSPTYSADSKNWIVVVAVVVPVTVIIIIVIAVVLYLRKKKLAKELQVEISMEKQTELRTQFRQ